MDSPFDEYIKVFREKKIRYHRNNQMALRKLAKRMMNSLYGKFAQRNEVEDRYTHDKPGEGEIYRKLTDNTWMIGNIEKERANETVVCFSSYITCYAQCLLYSFFNDGIHYCDTDSVVLEEPLSPELIDEDEFGLVALEHEVIRSNFVSPKRYMFETSEGVAKRVCKGVSQTSLNSMSIETYHHDVGVFYDKPFKEKTALRKNVPVFSLEKVRKVLSIKRVNEKRIFDEYGNSRPVTLVKVS
jgi:hypothetical protein